MPLILKGATEAQIKTLAKNLHKNLKKHPTAALSLGACQNMLAQALGHEDWHGYISAQPQIIQAPQPIGGDEGVWDNLFSLLQKQKVAEKTIRTYVDTHWDALIRHPDFIFYRLSFFVLCTQHNKRGVRMVLHHPNIEHAHLADEVAHLSTDTIDGWIETHHIDRPGSICAADGTNVLTQAIERHDAPLCTLLMDRGADLFDDAHIWALLNAPSMWDWCAGHIATQLQDPQRTGTGKTWLDTCVYADVIAEHPNHVVFVRMLRAVAAQHSPALWHWSDLVEMAVVGQDTAALDAECPRYEPRHWDHLVHSISTHPSISLFDWLLDKDQVLPEKLALVAIRLGGSEAFARMIAKTPRWSTFLPARPTRTPSYWSKESVLTELVLSPHRTQIFDLMDQHGFDWTGCYDGAGHGENLQPCRHSFAHKIASLISTDRPENNVILSALDDFMHRHPDAVLCSSVSPYGTGSGLFEQLCSQKETDPILMALHHLSGLSDGPLKTDALIDGAIAYLKNNTGARAWKKTPKLDDLQWERVVIEALIQAGLSQGLAHSDGRVFSWASYLHTRRAFAVVAGCTPVHILPQDIMVWAALVKDDASKRQHKTWNVAWREMLDLFFEQPDSQQMINTPLPNGSHVLAEVCAMGLVDEALALVGQGADPRLCGGAQSTPQIRAILARFERPRVL